MLNIRFSIVILCWCTLFNLVSNAQQASANLCGLKNSTTHANEKIKFKVFYTLAGVWVPAAEVTFTNTLCTFQNKTCYHLQGEGHTLKSYEWFFKVKDLYESYVDTSTMLTQKFVRNVHEGGTRIYNSVLFNQAEQKAISTNGVFKTTACVQDILSSVYLARNIDYTQFKVNDKIHFSVFLDDKTEPVYIEYLGTQTLKTPYGKFNTIKFRPKLIPGTIFTAGTEMIVYVTNDERKIPVYIETPILIGKIRAYWVP